MFPVSDMANRSNATDENAGLNSNPLHGIGGMIQTKTCLEFFVTFMPQDLALNAEGQPPSCGFVEPNSVQLWEGVSVSVQHHCGPGTMPCLQVQ